MSVKNLDVINVLNYNENVVAVSTKNENYLMQPAENDNPSVLPLTPSEIEYINGSSGAFKLGILRFEKEIEEEVYTKLLKIINWKDILSNDEITDILLNPTLEGLQKLINLKTHSEFERVRGLFTRLKNSKDTHISIQVERIINARYKELVNHQTKTSIELKQKDIPQVVNAEDVDALKEQNDALQRQMTEMQKALEKMMTLQEKKDDEKSKESEEKISTGKKKVGRPPANNKK